MFAFEEPTTKRTRESESSASKRTAQTRYVQNIMALLKNPINARLRFDEGRKCVVFSSADGRSVTCKGLLPALSATFYPQYDYFDAQNSDARRNKGADAANDDDEDFSSAGVTALVKSAKAQMGLKSRELGSHIDKEHSLVASMEYASATEKRKIALQIEAGGCCIFTELLLKSKACWGWKTIKTQFVIRDPLSGIATMIDEVCHDKLHRLIIVEHKYGYETYRDKANFMMMEPLEDIENSPRNQHFLQIGWAALVLKKIWQVDVHAAFVVYITDAMCEPVPLPAWFCDREELIWSRFQEVMQRRL
jgi:hypothetical protein